MIHTFTPMDLPAIAEAVELEAFARSQEAFDPLDRGLGLYPPRTAEDLHRLRTHDDKPGGTRSGEGFWKHGVEPRRRNRRLPPGGDPRP